MKTDKVVNAAALIKDGDTVTPSGFVGIGEPDELLAAVEKRVLGNGPSTRPVIVFGCWSGRQ